MHEVLVNRLGGLSLPRKSVVRLTDRPDMTLDVYHGRKTTMHYLPSCTNQHFSHWYLFCKRFGKIVNSVDSDQTAPVRDCDLSLQWFKH